VVCWQDLVYELGRKRVFGGWWLKECGWEEANERNLVNGRRVREPWGGRKGRRQKEGDYWD